MEKIFSLVLIILLLGGAGTSAEAQKRAQIPRIGFLVPGSTSSYANQIEAFRQGLRELGYVEGKNIVIDY